GEIDVVVAGAARGPSGLEFIVVGLCGDRFVVAFRAVPVVLREYDSRIIMDRVVEPDYVVGAPGLDARKHLAHVNLVDHYVKADVVSGFGVYLVYGVARLGVDYLAGMARDAERDVPPRAAVECERVVAGITGFSRGYVPYRPHRAAVRNEIERRIGDE